MSLKQSNIKIRDLAINENKNEVDIASLSKQISNIKTIIDRVSVPINIKNKKHTLYESEWIATALSHPIVGSTDTGSYIEWRLSMTQIPLKYIPFVNITLLHAYVDEEIININPSPISGQFRYGYFWNVVDIVDNEIVGGTPTLIVGVSIGTVGGSVISQSFKIIVNLYNPEQFI